jgi:anti-sigma factor RsiW
MNPAESAPTRDQLLAMAFADGELDEAGRAELEERLRTSVELRRDVAEYKRLALIARQMAPPEPADLVWRELEREGLHRAGRSIGLTLVGAGVLGLVGWAGAALALAEGIPLVLKLLLGAVTLGLTALFLTVLRARLRTLPFDPYTEVRR